MSRVRPALLVVEPHSVTREMYVRTLARTWRVLACGDIVTATQYLTHEEIGAVVLEPVVPGGDNWSLVATIRANPATATVPVLICSVVSDRSRGLVLDANAHLVKPVAPQQLVQEVARWLSPHAEVQTPK